jgi:hypothetical protein
MYHTIFTHSPIKVYLGCFEVLAIITNAEIFLEDSSLSHNSTAWMKKASESYGDDWWKISEQSQPNAQLSPSYQLGPTSSPGHDL